MVGISLVGVWLFLNFRTVDQLSQIATVNRHISYTLAVKNVGPSLLPEADVWIRGPNKKIAGQACLSLQADLSFNLETDQVNNQVMQFSLTKIPPYATIIINIDAQLSMQKQITEGTLKDENEFLHEEKYIEISTGELKDLAAQLASNTPKETAKNIFSWVSRNIAKTEYSRQPKGAVYALRKRKGDCTEFMHLLIALCRLNNIPARSVNGYVTTKNSHVSANDLHDWAQVYFGKSWHLADPFYNAFMEDEDKYIAIQVQRDNLKLGSFYRWKTTSPHLQIEMLN